MAKQDPNHNRITAEGFTGTLSFLKHLKHGYYTATDIPPEEIPASYYGREHVLVGSVEVDVQFEPQDTTQAEIAALRNQVQDIRAEAQLRVNQLEERIQNLLAISHQPEDASDA